MMFTRLEFEGERVAWQNRKMARRLRDAEHNATVANESWDRAVAERDAADWKVVHLLEENVALQHELDEARSDADDYRERLKNTSDAYNRVANDLHETTLRLRSFAARLEQLTGDKVVEAVSDASA